MDGGLAHELFQLLRKHGLPETATRYCVRVDGPGDLIKIECEFIATKPDEPEAK
jgi:hypothetical protein